ncbi:hypothetical protein T492DRAFT_1127149 [Pavlovales sp. CCMP2436]|nr:hypothetical protein T492DRAFT_1127149 [Pavlovales sp. CCMP2436]
MNMIWDVRMLYVAVSRVRTIKQLAVIMSAKQTRYMGEGVEHRTEKARQFGLARAAGQGAIEEYPVGDGRFIADLAVFDIADNGKMKLVKIVEVVVTSPPTKEKLAYYKELGLECEVVYIEKEPPKQSVNFQNLLSLNAGRKARRGVNSDLLGCYNFGDIVYFKKSVGGATFTVKGDLIDPETNSLIPCVRFSANEKTLRIINYNDEEEDEDEDEDGDEDIINECDTLPVLLRLMELRQTKKNIAHIK